MLVKALHDTLGIPREEALQMPTIEIDGLLLVHDANIERRKRDAEEQAKKAKAKEERKGQTLKRRV